MSAGTVISGGFPGRVAQEVQPNQKCEGCLHYDRQVGRTGACTIGLHPWNCGDGEAPEVSYSPLVRGANGPDLSNHGVHAPEVDAQHVSGLYGTGSTRPVTIQQVVLGEEHVHLVKSLVERHAELQKSQCRLCSMRGSHGIGPMNAGAQECSCVPLQAVAVAKALAARMSNAQRAQLQANPNWVQDTAEWVRAVAKAGFRAPAPSTNEAPRSVLRRSLADQLRLDDGGGHLRPMAKAFTTLGNNAVRLTGVAHSDDTKQAHERAYDAHKKAAAEGGPKASYHEQHVAYHRQMMEKSEQFRGGDLEKAIDNTKHSHIVTGKLAPHGVGASGRRAAHAKGDKLDTQYGSPTHTVARNPNYKPTTLKWEKTSAYGPGGHTAEAGHGTYVHRPESHGQHSMTYIPHGQGEAGALHGGSHASPALAHAAAQTHHTKTIGN